MAINIIGLAFENELTLVLRRAFIAISVDESTDISRDKVLAIVVRFNDPDTGLARSFLWDMVLVFKKGEKAKADANRLFECIVTSFTKHDIPLDNIFVCSFDNCSTMTGDLNGLKVKLENAIPGIIIVGCPVHKTHLCVTHALGQSSKGFHVNIR